VVADATLARRYGLLVEPVPVLFAGLLEAHGTTGPAETPAKSIWMFKNNLRKAALLGVPLNSPAYHPFNPLLALRATTAARDADECDAFITRLFEAVWVRKEHVRRAGGRRARRKRGRPRMARRWCAASEPEAKSALRAQTDDALARGVFGVPTMEMNGEIFWGYDDLPYLELFLAGEDPLARSSWGRSDSERPAPLRDAASSSAPASSAPDPTASPHEASRSRKQVPAGIELAFDAETRTLSAKASDSR
jgi:2-hydroxychromene-2-carboxylate isomerase